jgi:hypothetical protein
MLRPYRLFAKKVKRVAPNEDNALNDWAEIVPTSLYRFYVSSRQIKRHEQGS